MLSMISGRDHAKIDDCEEIHLTLALLQGHGPGLQWRAYSDYRPIISITSRRQEELPALQHVNITHYRHSWVPPIFDNLMSVAV
jgi:hypothetical protein